VIGNTLGKRSLFIYLSTIIIGSFAGGIILDNFMPASWFRVMVGSGHHHHLLPDWLMIGSALILSILVLYSLINKMIMRFRGKDIAGAACDLPDKKKQNELLVHIKGMTCSHCVTNVEKSLSSLDGATKVVVDLTTGSARVSGQVDTKQITESIKQLGYEVTGIE
jgi:uncharacterized protein